MKAFSHDPQSKHAPHVGEKVSASHGGSVSPPLPSKRPHAHGRVPSQLLLGDAFSSLQHVFVVGTAASARLSLSPRNLLRSCYFHSPPATLRWTFPRWWHRAPVRTGAFSAWLSGFVSCDLRVEGCGSSAGRVCSTEWTGATASSTWPCCCGPGAWVDWLTFPVRSDPQIKVE